mgnify:CR=1 FL=1
MLDPATGNLTIDNIAKVSAVFGLEPWQILHPAYAGAGGHRSGN